MRTENAVLKARRPTGPHFVMGTSAADVDTTVIRAALCLTGKLKSPDKHFEPKVLEIAGKHCKGWSLQRAIIHFAQKNGYQGDPFAAFHIGNCETTLRAAFSTMELPSLLSSTAERFAINGLQSKIGTIWRLFSRIVSMPDFRPTQGVNMIESNEYEEVGPTGDIPHGTLSESAWTNRVKSYAKMLEIPFQAIKNDDLGFLQSAEKLLGRGADRSINKQWWTEFMDNSAFFSSAHGNYAEGAGTVLSADSLAVFEALFAAQTTEEGDETDFEPRYLLVPPALAVKAQELYQSTNWNTGGSSTTDRVANTNIWAGKYEPVVARQLANANYTGYSSTAWFLLADPDDAPAMEVGFLDGKEQPIIEKAETDFEKLPGVKMRGHIHYGVKKAEYRAGTKSKGAA